MGCRDGCDALPRDCSGNDTRGIGDKMGRRTFVQAAGLGLGALTLGTGATAATGSDITKTDLEIESFDGTTIGATLMLPEESGPNPAILMTHGWGSWRGSPLTAPKALNYAKNGYVVLTYDSRGFGDTGGTSNLNGPGEVKDARHLIDWLAEREEVETEDPGNPKLGMDGISYAGGIQPLVASEDDRVDAIVPRMTWGDLTYSLVPNGGVKLSWLSILLGLGVVGTFGFEDGADLTDKLFEWYEETLVDNEAPEDAIEGFEKRSLSEIEEFDTPAFFIQGWDDTLFKPNEALSSFEKLQDMDTETRIAFYAGGHALEEITVPLGEREYMNDLAVKWMDRHLRDEDVDIETVHTWLKQDEEWRTGDQFPPADVSMTTYDLSEASADGSDTIEQWSLWYDEEVTYTWTVEEDIEVVGTPEFEFTVDVEDDEAILFFDVLANGDDLDAIGEAVGEVYRVDSEGTHSITFEFPTFQWFFDAGDELGVQVSVTDPLYTESRESDGVTIKPDESEIRLPQRPQ